MKKVSSAGKQKKNCFVLLAFGVFFLPKQSKHSSFHVLFLGENGRMESAEICSVCDISTFFRIVSVFHSQSDLKFGPLMSLTSLKLNFVLGKLISRPTLKLGIVKSASKRRHTHEAKRFSVEKQFIEATSSKLDTQI